MTNSTVIQFDKLPPVAPSYARALAPFRGGLAEGGSIPSITAEVDGLRVDARALRRYNRVCGFGDGDGLPITYPHVLAFPVHMAVMTHRQFPLGLMGLVHVRNAITQHRVIDASEQLSLRVSVGGHRQVHNGVEFDLATVAHGNDGECLWESTSTMLSRGGGSGRRPGRRSKTAADLPLDGHRDRWQVPADIGRRYARAAGDVNPIHMSALSAKLFGFPRAIAHGMWLKAHAVARMAAAIDADHYNIGVAFKRPVLLPTETQLIYKPSDDGLDFVLQNRDGETTHMVGDISYL